MILIVDLFVGIGCPVACFVTTILRSQKRTRLYIGGNYIDGNYIDGNADRGILIGQPPG